MALPATIEQIEELATAEYDLVLAGYNTNKRYTSQYTWGIDLQSPNYPALQEQIRRSNEVFARYDAPQVVIDTTTFRVPVIMPVGRAYTLPATDVIRRLMGIPYTRDVQWRLFSFQEASNFWDRKGGLEKLRTATSFEDEAMFRELIPNAQTYLQRISQGFYRRDLTRRSNTFNVVDTVFNSPLGQAQQFFNPITAATQLLSNFGRSPGNLAESIITSGINPPRTNWTQIGIESGVNIVGTIGMGYGTQGGFAALQGYASATTPLATGVQGAVNPGLWATLSSGNWVGAYDIVAAPFAAAWHASQPTGLSGKISTDIASAQTVQFITSNFLKLTGDIGKAIVQLVSGDLRGFANTVGIIPTPSPSPIPTLYKPTATVAGGGGFGPGYFEDTQYKQIGALAWVLLIGLVVLAFLKLRK